MQTVNYISDVQHTAGTIGFSMLYKTWGGEPQKRTVLYLRDFDGLTQSVIVLPADAVRGAF